MPAQVPEQQNPTAATVAPFACVCGAGVATGCALLAPLSRSCHNLAAIDRKGGRGAASPLVVFVCLLLLLGGIAGVVIWTGQTDAEPIPPAPAPSASLAPSETLTDEEAIAVFEELDQQRLKAFAQADRDLLKEAFYPRSPAMRRAADSIHELQTRGLILLHPRYSTRTLSVVHQTADEIRLQQTVVLRTRIVAQHADRKTSDRLKWQRVQWNLRKQGTNWRIYDGEVLAARFIKK